MALGCSASQTGGCSVAASPGLNSPLAGTAIARLQACVTLHAVFATEIHEKRLLGERLSADNLGPKALRKLA